MVALCLGVLWSSPSSADDGAVVAVGGAVSPMAQHPSIRLAAEFVHIDFRRSPAEVDCVFFLENAGPATTATIGFPNESGGVDVEEFVPFSSFVSYVDGDTAQVTVLPDAEHQQHGDYGVWYVKTVPFAAGQTRCVRNVYTGTHGGYSTGHSAFDYILWSGATWTGPIGVADLVVTWDPSLAPMDSLTIRPGGYSVSGNEIRWHFADFEPVRGADTGRIQLLWRNGWPRR